MNDILEKYGELSLAVKTLIIVGFIALTSVVHYFIIFSSQNDTHNSLLTQRSNLEEKKVEYEVKHKTLEVDRRYNRDLERSLALKKGNLPDKTEVERVVSLLDRRAEQAGVRIDTISPQKEVIKDLYVEKPLEIKVHGGFHKIMNFLYIISKEERIINMNDIVMDNPLYKNQEVILNAALTLKVYRFKKSTDLNAKDKKNKNKKKKKKKKGHK